MASSQEFSDHASFSSLESGSTLSLTEPAQKQAKPSEDKGPYCHAELQDDEIRLLKLPRDTNPIELRFDVRTFARHAAPKYVALSYVWDQTQ